MYGVGTYDLMLGEYDMGGNVLFYYTIQPHDQKIQFYKMAYYNKQFSFLSVLVPSPLSINNSNLLPIFQGTNFLPKKCFVLLKYLKSNLVLSLFQYVNLLSGRIKWLLKIKVYITTETNIEISQISLSSMINDILFSICQKRSWTSIRLATSEEEFEQRAAALFQNSESSLQLRVKSSRCSVFHWVRETTLRRQASITWRIRWDQHHRSRSLLPQITCSVQFLSINLPSVKLLTNRDGKT